MYEAFYGLNSKPFQLSPDPSFYFGSRQHRRAKAYLEYGVARSDGFVVITGDIGAGKTTILRTLLGTLDAHSIVVGQLVTTQLDAEDTLRMVAAAFGLRSTHVDKAELLSTLEAFLITHASQGRRCLLVVDEAQNLSARAVEELRMLSNFQLGSQAVLQSFLVGQPEFRQILQGPEMEQLRQRVAATCHIGPLDAQETQAYIEHRLACAGARDTPTFDPDVFPAVFQASGGIPRRINAVCDRLLLLGYMEERTHLTLHDVEEVVRDLAEEAHVPAPEPTRGLNGAAHGALQGAAAWDASTRALDRSLADAARARLSDSSLAQQGARLERLEDSLLRLERLEMQTLATLQELLQAIARPASSDGT